ncbi:hypothetical protein N7508_005287 [Penicillium antarcticum]|nr:uncharacterized protein N7508_005287 [Penicillium antarcticum]KAJ5306272.1 hypothetical protein N7508_005287 [Penicillium antarcticum]
MRSFIFSLVSHLSSSLRSSRTQIRLTRTPPLQLDSYKAAEESSFNINRSSNSYTTRPRWGGSSSYGGGGGGGGGGPGSGPRRVGRVDDVRAPECGSCR